MPVVLAIDHPTEVLLLAVFGCHYGIIRWQLAGSWVQAPVSFASVHAVGDYAEVMVGAAHTWLRAGGHYWVTASGCAEGALQELQIVEIHATRGGESWGEHAVAAGWALPAPLVAAGGQSQAYQRALAWARGQHAGIWGEATCDPTQLGLSIEVLQQTAPPPHSPHWAAAWGGLALVVVALMTGMRPRIAPGTTITRHLPAAGVRRPLRVLGRLLSWYGAGVVGAGLPTVRASVAPSAPTTTAAAAQDGHHGR